MTKQQIHDSSRAKVQAVEKLMEQLKLIVSAEQMITERGFIKQVVYYTDVEKYEVDEEKSEPITPKTDEVKA